MLCCFYSVSSHHPQGPRVIRGVQLSFSHYIFFLSYLLPLFVRICSLSSSMQLCSASCPATASAAASCCTLPPPAAPATARRAGHEKGCCRGLPTPPRALSRCSAAAPAGPSSSPPPHRPPPTTTRCCLLRPSHASAGLLRPSRAGARLHPPHVGQLRPPRAAYFHAGPVPELRRRPCTGRRRQLSTPLLRLAAAQLRCPCPTRWQPARRPRPCPH